MNPVNYPLTVACDLRNRHPRQEDKGSYWITRKKGNPNPVMAYWDGSNFYVHLQGPIALELVVSWCGPLPFPPDMPAC